MLAMVQPVLLNLSINESQILFETEISWSTQLKLIKKTKKVKI